MEINLSVLNNDFKKHLELPTNNRIIFSGAFGTGKTYFLDKFFESNSDFEAIHIYPTNYSVASNEDIFELIKYDILFKLLEKDLDYTDIKIDASAFLPFFLKNHSIEFIPIFLSLIPKVGGSLKSIAKGLIQLNTKFKKEFNEVNLSDSDNIIAYLEKFQHKEGSINEEDINTQIICSLIDQLNSNKKTVLIIDDLDRVDPEHIFRIMNVLAAHIDVKKDINQNKFNFNSIVLVCDIENIRRIFANRYGANVDFSGYIDKFYSNHIFKYDLSSYIFNRVDEVFRNIKINSKTSVEPLPSYQKNPAALLVQNILFAMIKNNLFSIRLIKKVFDREFILKSVSFSKKFKNNISPYYFPIVTAIKFFEDVFDNINTFRSIIFLLKDSKYSVINNNNEFLLSNIFYGFLIYDFTYYLEMSHNDEKIHYDIKLLNKYDVYFHIHKSFDESFSENYEVRNLTLSIGDDFINLEDINVFTVLSELLSDTKFLSILKIKPETD